MDKEKILLAGKIASQVRDYIRPLIKKGTPLLEIAEKIESKIIELGGKPAFPTNLSVDNIAAHYTPSHNDETFAHGLLKIDFGAHVDGWISDTAFSVDLENSGENKELIEASEQALGKVIEIFGQGAMLNKVGEIISKTIEAKGFAPVVNLSGHEINEYDLHAGLTVPNIPNKSGEVIEKGLYAIEPFASTGSGRVHDGKPSGIYQLVSEKNPRSSLAREVLNFIVDEYRTLPFCSRWLVKKFGTRALFALHQLEDNGNLHQFAQLVESSGTKISQAEHTILINDEGKTVTTG